jgi:membrane protein DedA with SNARE-associated domain
MSFPAKTVERDGPGVDVLRDFADTLLSFASDYIYLALFVLLLVEEAGVPLPMPGDTVILLAGSQVSVSDGGLFAAAALVVLATLIGSSALYWVSRLGGRPVLSRIFRWLRIKEDRLDRVGEWMRRNRGPAIVFGRLTPGLRTVTTMAAGTFHVSYPAFLAYTGISATIWAFLYLLIGAAITDFYQTVAAYLFRPSPLALGLLAFALSALGVAVWQWRRSARGRREPRGPVPVPSALPEGEAPRLRPGE